MSLLSPQLDAFLAVAERRTVHQAAKDLRLTQTGITQRLKALETTLGVSLFTRSRKGMLITSEGEGLLRYCRAAKEIEGPALAALQHAGEEAEVRVAITGPTSIMRMRIIPQALTVMKRFSALLVAFDLNDREDRDADLRSGAAQFAIVPTEQVAREMDSKRLVPERYVLVASRKWAKRKLGDILANERVIDFDKSDRMTFSYLKRFHLVDKVKPERHFVNNNEPLVEMFKAELGYGVLTTEFAKPFVQAGDLAILNAGRVLENTLALAWYPRPQMPAYFAALVKAIR